MVTLYEVRNLQDTKLNCKESEKWNYLPAL